MQDYEVTDFGGSLHDTGVEAPIAYEEPHSILRWDSLASFTRSRVILGYQLLLITTPIIAAFTNSISELPFLISPSVIFAYAGGISFFLAAISVELICPDICRLPNGYSSIVSQRRTLQYIVQRVRDIYILHSNKPEKANHFINCMINSETYVKNLESIKSRNSIPDGKTSTLLDTHALFKLIDDTTFSGEAFPELFWTLHWFASSTMPRSRSMIAFFIVLGIFFMFMVLASPIVDNFVGGNLSGLADT